MFYLLSKREITKKNTIHIVRLNEVSMLIIN